MVIAGIIAEYNPFHNGHAYQAAEVRRRVNCDGVVAVMSGSFVQRGDVACCDKWSRAAMAVHNGVDLVIELPFEYAGQSAGYFASGAVRLLDAMGVVDYLCFGVESEEMEAPAELARLADIIAGEKHTLKAKLRQGASFAAARGAVFGEHEQAASLPNNILALEYVTALKTISSKMQPLPLTRTGGINHNQADVPQSGKISSATAIRRLLSDNLSKAADFMPDSAYTILSELVQKGAAPLCISALETAILAMLRCAPLEQLAELPDVTEGLERRLQSAANKAINFDELIFGVKSKRYALSRIRRIAVNALIGVTREDLQTPPQYIRVLAANETGRAILKSIKLKSELPIITKIAAYKSFLETSRQLQLDITAANIAALAVPNQQYRTGNSDFYQHPFFC